MATASAQPARRSLIGLNTVNFFLAELVAVVGPFLSVYLKGKGWSYAQIGVGMAAGGFGSLLLQIPAGYICDKFKKRRLLLSMACLTMGLCFVGIPLHATAVWYVTTLLLFTGFANAFFIPLLSTLALALGGSKHFADISGKTQSWNHLGNISAAAAALFIVHRFGVESIFFVMASVSVLTVGATLIIRGKDLKHEVEPKQKSGQTSSVWDRLCHFAKDPQTRILLLAVACFHMANTPVLPLLGLYIKKLGGDDTNVAWTVFVAQAVMVPTAILAGKYCANIGRKPIFMIAMVILPIRILLYTLTEDRIGLLSIQVFDGIGAGIYGVAIPLMCDDITKRTGGFNTLLAVAQTALAFGGFAGPLVQGLVTESIGFKPTFYALSAIGLLGTVIFGLFMTETKGKSYQPHK